MGMTIDEAIQNIEIVKEDYWEDDGYGNETKEYEDTMQSFDMLIDIAKKYQKIDQIIKEHDNDRMPEDYWYIDKIREVLEDGSKFIL